MNLFALINLFCLCLCLCLNLAKLEINAVEVSNSVCKNKCKTRTKSLIKINNDKTTSRVNKTTTESWPEFRQKQNEQDGPDEDEDKVLQAIKPPEEAGPSRDFIDEVKSVGRKIGDKLKKVEDDESYDKKLKNVIGANENQTPEEQSKTDGFFQSIKRSKIPSYKLAATNTRVVGALIAFFINSLCNAFDIENDKFWLIGHSLGAHTAGYAGKRLFNPKLARITGLDPAGVSFHYKNAALRLDASDATIVDAIHTDSALHYTEGFGIHDNLGHYDFYPNGGNWQPGCPKSDNIKEKISSLRAGEDITCSHSRACIITTNLDKPEDDCSAVAYQCESYDTFLEGRCADCRDDRCKPMGLNPNYWLGHKPNPLGTGNLKYYINTGAKEEYCLNHYQIALHASNDTDAATGILLFAIQTQNGSNIEEIPFQRIMTRTVTNNIHTLLVTFDFLLNLTLDSSLFVQWQRYNESEKIRINRGFTLRFPVIEFNYMSHTNNREREDYSMIFCPKIGTGRIIPNKPRTEFVRCRKDMVSSNSALVTDSADLVPLTVREDLFSVDYQNNYPIFRKILKSSYLTANMTTSASQSTSIEKDEE